MMTQQVSAAASDMTNNVSMVVQAMEQISATTEENTIWANKAVVANDGAALRIQVPPAEREWLVSVIRNPQFSSEDFGRLVELLGSCGAIRYAEQAAEKFIAAAKDELSAFPPSAALETLADIADYALHRRV